MALVRGHDTYTAMELVPCTTWGTTPGTPTWEGVPLVGEGLVVEPFQFPKSQELGNTGAASAVDTGRQLVRGEFTVYPYYDAPWFWKLMCNAFGGQERRDDARSLTGSAVPGTYSGHSFVPQSYTATATGSESGIARGFTFRVWKSGNDTSGYIDTFLGVTVTGFTWNQPEDDLPTVTFRVLAQAPTTAGASGSPATPVGSKQVKIRDLTRTTPTNNPSLIQAGAVLTTLNVRAFSVTYDGSVDFGPAFMNAPDTVSIPGHNDVWSVTGEINSLGEQTLGANNTPYEEFVNGQSSQIKLRYSSPDLCMDGAAEALDVPYAIELRADNITWTDADASVARGGAIETRFAFEAAQSTIAMTATSRAVACFTPLMVQCNVADGDDSQATFCTAAQGGNDVDADLL